MLHSLLKYVRVPAKINKLSAAQMLELSFKESAQPHSGVITKLCTFYIFFWCLLGIFLKLMVLFFTYWYFLGKIGRIDAGTKFQQVHCTTQRSNYEDKCISPPRKMLFPSTKSSFKLKIVKKKSNICVLLSWSGLRRENYKALP